MGTTVDAGSLCANRSDTRIEAVGSDHLVLVAESHPAKESPHAPAVRGQDFRIGALLLTVWNPKP